MYKEIVLNINNESQIRNTERRRKRLIVPIFYFLVEAVLVWLVLALIELEFDVREWSIWSIGIFLLGGLYSIAKTVHVYDRQKNYPAQSDKV